MVRLGRFGKDVVNGWLEAGAFNLAASLAYYAIFAIAPVLLISIYLASFFFDRTAAVEGLTRELIGVIGPTGSDAIKQMLDAAGTAEPKGWAGLVGIAVLLFAAAGFVGSLQDALDKIWRAPPRPEGIWSFIRTKLFSFSLILAAAFLLLVSLVLSTAMTALTGRIANAMALPDWSVAVIILIANFLLSVLIFAAIFRFVPSVEVTCERLRRAAYSRPYCLH
jgi:membrane protein